jgi:hypothetical protein
MVRAVSVSVGWEWVTLSRKRSSSTGNGSTSVEFLSAATSTTVCNSRSCSAAECSRQGDDLHVDLLEPVHDRNQYGETRTERRRTHPPASVDDTSLVLLDHAEASACGCDPDCAKHCHKHTQEGHVSPFQCPLMSRPVKGTRTRPASGRMEVNVSERL